MKSTKIETTIQSILQQLHSMFPLLAAIIEQLHQKGAQILLIGGAVRDGFLGLATKDYDIELHGITADNLEIVLKQFGPVSIVGKSFGVFKLHGIPFDWSLPRTDSAGRKPQVTIDPHMSYEQAFARRDLTINAMGINLVTHELIDPFNGLHDLEKKILRTPDATLFEQDPLRFFRVMQFIGRFAMVPDEQLNKICKHMDISTVSAERIHAEFEKLFLQAHEPSLGIKWINNIGRLEEVLPELAATRGIEQNPLWHPEGDVFEHTMQALDGAARLYYQDDERKFILMCAALSHDLGKTTTTQLIDGVLRSFGHEYESVRIAKTMLPRITAKQAVIQAALILIECHMMPGQFVKSGAKAPAYKRLALRCKGHATLFDLAQLALVDKRGRNKNKGAPLIDFLPDVQEFIVKANEAGVLLSKEEPLLLGKDIVDIVEPGPHMGKLLKRAYELQLEQGITDKEELKQKLKKLND